MKPSEHCKAVGLRGLDHLAELTGRSKGTLINWHRDNYKLFEAALKSAVESKRESGK